MSALTSLVVIDDLAQRVFARRSIIYVPSSRVWTAHADGVAVFRCLGAGGSGAVDYLNSAQGLTGGSAGTVGLHRVRVRRGDQFAVTIPAGGASVSGRNGNGKPGGTLTVTGPGVDIQIPGAPGGISGAAGAQNPEAADPSGLDEVIKSARNTVVANAVTGGASAALLLGGQSWPSEASSSYGSGGAGVAGPNRDYNAGPSLAFAAATVDCCWLLVSLGGANGAGGAGSGGPTAATNGGFGGGGGGARAFSRNDSAMGGNAGAGAGGGAAGYLDNYLQSRSGAGGAGFVTIELLEVNP